MAKILLAYILLVPSVVLSACATPISTSPNTTANQEVRVGITIPLTGILGEVGNAIREGADLAAEQINLTGGINGKLVKLFYGDDKLEARTAVDIVNKFVYADKVNAVVTSGAQEIKPISPVLINSGTPGIVTWDSDDEIGAIGYPVFSIGLNADIAGRKMARFAVDKLKIRTVVVVKLIDEWSMLISNSFMDEFAKLGGRTLWATEVGTNEKDFRTILSKAKQLNPDAIYAPLIAHLAEFFIQKRELGVDRVMLTGDALTQEVVNRSGDAAENVIATLAIVSDDEYPATMDMVRFYQAKFNKEPTLTIHNAFGYDAINLIAHAIKLSGDDSRTGISAGLKKTTDFAGAYGPVDFSRSRITYKGERVYQVVNGKFRPIE